MAKLRPLPTLGEIESQLGYHVDPTHYPNESVEFFYSDLRPVPESLYERSVEEYEEYERGFLQKGNDASTSVLSRLHENAVGGHLIILLLG